MKLSIKILPFLAFLALVLWCAPKDVAAKECGSYGGTCRAGCASDEFSAYSLYSDWNSTVADQIKKTEQALDLQPGEVINCNGQGTCCIPKGTEACSHIGYAYYPPADGMAWGCTPLECGDPLSGGTANREYCPSGQKCCKYKVRVGTTTAKPVIIGSPTNISNPLGSTTTLTGAIRRVLTVFLGMVGALAFVVFVYAGVTWMTAGSSDRVKVAKDAMKYAVIGLILIGFSFAITNFIIDALANKGSFSTPATPAPVQEATPLQ
ncbi:MAG: pilin [Patescibacteria group bacterium]